MSTLAQRSQEFQHYAADSRTDVLELLKTLVETEGASREATEIRRLGDTLGTELDQLGLQVDSVPSEEFGLHLRASNGDSTSPAAVLIGHLDTVFPAGSGWPFAIRDNVATGPGVADMKGGLVVLLFALRALAAVEGPRLPVRVLLVGDEEVGSPESNALIEESAEGAAWGLVFEPAGPDGAVISHRKAFGQYFLSVTGSAAHAGLDPESGIDANRELVSECASIYGLARPDRGTTINIGRIEGGRAPAIVSDHARAQIDVRADSESEWERVHAALRQRSRTTETGAVVEFEGGMQRPAMTPTDDTRRLMRLVSDAGSACGQPVVFGSSGAVSDGNNLAAAGIATLDGLGPIGGRTHSRDEFLRVDSVFDRITLVASVLSAMADQLDESGGGDD